MWRVRALILICDTARAPTIWPGLVTRTAHTRASDECSVRLSFWCVFTRVCDKKEQRQFCVYECALRFLRCSGTTFIARYNFSLSNTHAAFLPAAGEHQKNNDHPLINLLIIVPLEAEVELTCGSHFVGFLHRMQRKHGMMWAISMMQLLERELGLYIMMGIISAAGAKKCELFLNTC